MTHDEATQHMEESLAEALALPQACAAHVEECAECAQRWDRLCAAERALEGVEGLSARALAEVDADVFSAVPQPRKPQAWWPRLVVAAPLLSAAGVLLWLSLPGNKSYQPRGAESAALPVGLRVMCLHGDAVLGETLTSTGEASVLHCGLEDVLAFAVTSQAGSPWRHVFVVGSQGQGEVRWYHPRPQDDARVPLPELPVTNHLLPSVRLAVNHQPGPAQVLAIFSEQPISAEAVAAALRGGRVEQSLPGPVLVQRAVVSIP